MADGVTGEMLALKFRGNKITRGAGFVNSWGGTKKRAASVRVQAALGRWVIEE